MAFPVNQLQRAHEQSDVPSVRYALEYGWKSSRGEVIDRLITYQFPDRSAASYGPLNVITFQIPLGTYALFPPTSTFMADLLITGAGTTGPGGQVQMGALSDFNFFGGVLGTTAGPVNAVPVKTRVSGQSALALFDQSRITMLGREITQTQELGTVAQWLDRWTQSKDVLDTSAQLRGYNDFAIEDDLPLPSVLAYTRFDAAFPAPYDSSQRLVIPLGHFSPLFTMAKAIPHVGQNFRLELYLRSAGNALIWSSAGVNWNAANTYSLSNCSIETDMLQFSPSIMAGIENLADGEGVDYVITDVSIPQRVNLADQSSASFDIRTQSVNRAKSVFTGFIPLANRIPSTGQALDYNQASYTQLGGGIAGSASNLIAQWQYRLGGNLLNKQPINTPYESYQEGLKCFGNFTPMLDVSAMMLLCGLMGADLERSPGSEESGPLARSTAMDNNLNLNVQMNGAQSGLFLSFLLYVKVVKFRRNAVDVFF